MILILMVCIMKLLEMSTMRRKSDVGHCRNGGGGGEKENRAINGHLRNYFSSVQKHHGSKTHRGMIDQSQKQIQTNPNEDITAVQQPKQPIFNFQRHQPFVNQPHNGASPTIDPFRFSCSPPDNRPTSNPAIAPTLTESGLQQNVQIVLNNLNQNALRLYLNRKHKLNQLNGNDSGAVPPTKQPLRPSPSCGCPGCQQQQQRKTSGTTMLSSPESDCNSNPHLGGGSLLGCSIASSHDFTHDNSDYQWFLDYGYRDGVTHQSILSSLSASYNGIGELSYYEDLAKNIDANLAEVDMESFSFRQHHEDTQHQQLNQHNQHNQLQDNDLHHHHQKIIRVNSDLMDNSICKSKQLFSPVKETISLSVDSLDLDGFREEDEDLILTCRANKNNYTIAFEGSQVYSEESYYGGHGGKLDDIVKRKALEVSMSRSDTGFTTWSKLKKNSSQSQLQRYPSGNNNTTSITAAARHAPHCFVRKSSSLPNLQLDQQHQHPSTTSQHHNQLHQLHVSQALSSSTVDSYAGGNRMRSLMPMYPMAMPTSSVSSGSQSPAPLHLQQSSTTSSGGAPTTGNQPAFNLVKLFIKQKSSSTDTCMDVSSGCWPSDSPSSSLEQQRQRKKSMNDSGKGSALSRHDEDMESGDFQYDSLDVASTNQQPKPNRSNDLYREVFDSPAHRQHAGCPLNIKTLGQPKLLTNLNNNNSIEKDSLKETNTSLTDDSRTSENLTQVFAKAQIPVDLMSRSIQTSMILSKTSEHTHTNSRIKIVPPSFLAQLSHNSKMGDSQAAPVYVIYPNYALPDLGFVNKSDVILSPLSYTKTAGASSLTGTYSGSSSMGGGVRAGGNIGGVGGSGKNQRRRPVSLLDCDELVRNKDYGHVADWQSLAYLLPTEYRNLLRHIPEVGAQINSPTVVAAASQKPIFSMSPPIRRSQPAPACDCDTFSHTISTGSGSSDQRGGSSGYRGSSTLLTDSEMGTPTGDNPAMRNMYVYQYDNNSHMDATGAANDPTGTDRPPSGRTPRGILRRTNSKIRIKRNSMIEESESPTGLKLDKRRSLQDQQYYNENNLIQDYLADLNEKDQQQHRLTNSRVYSPKYYDDSPKASGNGKSNLNYIEELNEEQVQRRIATDDEARSRTQQLMRQVPKSDLTYYTEVANILKSIEQSTELYDRHKLRNQVSLALCQHNRNPLMQQKKVSFEGGVMGNTITINTQQPTDQSHHLLSAAPAGKGFTTPPNSPNISVAQLRLDQKQKRNVDQEKLDKIQSNRFKRLQIQWELLSKEAHVLEKELAGEPEPKEVRSGGSTPTTPAALRSKIPRPVSYPATKPTPSSSTAKQLQSPSRLATPKRYGATAAPAAAVSAKESTTPRSRTPSKLNTTPKKTAAAIPRTTSARR